MSKIKAEGKNGEMIGMAREALRGKLAPMETEIYRGRNILTELEKNGCRHAVKYFSRTLKNRLVYAIWSSKARRSYEHAVELLRRGIATPDPESYAEERGPLNILLNSVYICRYEESISLDDYLQEGEESWLRFAAFAAQLHKKGIIHKDLNRTNARVNKVGDEVVFSLIDLNRMKILPEGEVVSGDDAYRNLIRFCYYGPEFHTFAKEYCRLMGIGEDGYNRMIELKKQRLHP